MGAESVYCGVMLKKIDQQYGSIGTLDDKLSKAFGFVNAVLPIYIGLLIAERNRLNHHPVWVICFGTAGAFIYGLLLFLTYAGYKASDWDWRPNRNALRTFVGRPNTSQEATELWVGDEILKTLDANDEILKRKGASLTLLLLLMPCEVLVLAASAIASLF